jgi:hypothetical protein
MRKIELKKIIKRHNLDVWEVAKHLFPNNRYPRLALNRVMAGEAVLDANQISKLSALTGITFDNLFSNSGWKVRIDKRVHTFTNGEYKAELDTETWTTTVFHKKSLMYEDILHTKTISIEEYIIKLDTLINQFNENEKSRKDNPGGN